VERQKRMIIDGEDFYLDLLSYHRILKRLVAVELKLGKFQARDKGLNSMPPQLPSRQAKAAPIFPKQYQQCRVSYGRLVA
jgi:hypothetical protein